MDGIKEYCIFTSINKNHLKLDSNEQYNFSKWFTNLGAKKISIRTSPGYIFHGPRTILRKESRRSSGRRPEVNHIFVWSSVPVRSC